MIIARKIDRVKVPDLSMRRYLSIMVEVDVDDPTTNVRDVAP
jgi:hypothetical protein